MIAFVALLLAASSPAADTRSLYLQLIHQARADGRPRAALAYLDDFDRRHPADADARILRINSLLDLGDIASAEAIAATLPPDPAFSAVRGHLQSAHDHWTEALPFYQSAMQSSPADPLLRNALGYAQLRAGSPDQAVETLRGALDLSPADPTIRNNLLLALTVAGRRSEAEVLLRQIRDDRAQDSLRRQLIAQAARISP